MSANETLTLTAEERARARRRMIETWPTAAEIQQEFVEVVRPFVKTNDLLLLEKWTIWHWSYDLQWNTHRIIEVDYQRGADLDRLKELFSKFETPWRSSLNIDGFVIGEEYSPEPEPERRKTEWEWRTLADAYKPKSPREYVVDGLLPLPSLSIFFGSPGELKTMLVQDLSLCVAAGKPWLEGESGQSSVQPFVCKQAAVLWVDIDNGLDRTERRFEALGKTHDIPEDAPLAYVSFPVPPFIASDSRSIDRIIKAAQTVDAKLIGIDYLGAISGGADENSSQMVAVMSGLRKVAEMTGAAVVVIHHRTKSDKSRLGNSLRGHSSIEGAVDLALMIEREEGADTVVLRSTKSRDAPVEPCEALWTYKSDGRDLLAGRFYGLGAAMSEADKNKAETKALVLEIITAGPRQNQSEIVDAVKDAGGPGRGLVLFVLKELESEGKVRVEQGDRNAKLYYP